MGEKTFDIFYKNRDELKAWVKSCNAASPGTQNAIGALAEIVYARHAGGIIVSEKIDVYDVKLTGPSDKTVEVKTRLNGNKANFTGKVADVFAQVYFEREAGSLSVIGIRTRDGQSITVDTGENPWSFDDGFSPYVVDIDAVCEDWIGLVGDN